MRLLKILLILPIIGYGAVKGYIWYKVKDNADTAIAQMAPFAEVSYGSIFSSLKGAAGVEDLVIRPKMTSDEFTIQKLSFTAGNLLELFTLSQQLQEKKLPTHLGLEVQKLSLDLDSEMFSMLAQMQNQGGLQRKPTVIERMDAMACGSIESFGIKELSDMGYNHMVLDIKMDMGYQEERKLMNIAMQFKDRALYSANFKSSFRFDIPEIVAAGRSYEPEISLLSAEYNDTGYYALRNEYCAKQRGSSIDEYIEANITGLSSGVGVSFPEEAIENYRKYMTKGGSLRVSLKPSGETSFSHLKLYEPKQVMSMLGVEIAINGVKVDQEKIVWGSGNYDSQANLSAGPKQKQNPKPKQLPKSMASKAEIVPAPPIEAVVSEPQFHAVNKSKLSGHIGKRIQVVTVNGKQRDGMLESVGKERIRIRMQLGSGEYSFPVKLKEIKQAQVFM